VQLTLSMVLAGIALDDTPNRVALVLVVAGIGCAGAISSPTANALLPTLVRAPTCSRRSRSTPCR
jgi:hypothetical protein